MYIAIAVGKNVYEIVTSISAKIDAQKAYAKLGYGYGKDTVTAFPVSKDEYIGRANSANYERVVNIVNGHPVSTAVEV